MNFIFRKRSIVKTIASITRTCLMFKYAPFLGVTFICSQKLCAHFMQDDISLLQSTRCSSHNFSKPLIEFHPIPSDMDHSIVVDFATASERYNQFGTSFPHKKLPPAFRYNLNESQELNLNRLALFALQPKTTLACFYAYNEIFLDIVARWVANVDLFELAYCDTHLMPTPDFKGSLVFLALSRVFPIFHECASFIDTLLQETQLLTKALSLTGSFAQDLKVTLLSLYRIYNSKPSRFEKYINSSSLYQVLSLGYQHDVSKYLAVKILSLYLNASEVSKNKMISTHIQSKSLESSFDGEIKIDYEFVDLVDAQTFSDFTHLPSNVQSSQSHKVSISASTLSPSVICVCGILIAKLSNVSLEPLQDTVVPTTNATHVLKTLAQLFLERKAVLLHGEAGAGKTFLINQFARYLACHNDIVKIHLGEQTDAKLLTGAYTSGEKPGSFEWRSGVLATAVREGKWVLVEDIDKAPTEVLSILLTLLEKRELNIPSRGEVIKASTNFQLFATIRTLNNESSLKLPDIIGLRLWKCIAVETPHELETRAILSAKFPILQNLISKFITVFETVISIYTSPSFISLNRGLHPRVISIRDLMKFCSRCNVLLINSGMTSPNDLISSAVYENIFYEAVECFGSALTEYGALHPLVNSIGEILEIPASRVNFYITNYVPVVHDDEEKIEIGRAVLKKSIQDKALYVKKKLGNDTSFARTKHSRRLMEQVGIAAQMCEPILLVGETGTGKTTIVQEIAKMMNKKLTVINVSQQTESGDLLGGYKPVNTKSVAIPIQERFESLFLATFSQKKNAKFSNLLSKCFNRNQWKNVIKLWKEAVKMAEGILSKTEDSDEEAADGAPKKKRRLRTSEKSVLLLEWLKFRLDIDGFEAQAGNLANSFVFNFVEGSLVRAIKNGEWLLLDEINLASPDTLESIADLLSEDPSQRSVLLSERGDIDATVAHPDFRIFGCMNPSTDVGKRDLPTSIRSRFSEIYVHSPDKDRDDLTMIVDRYVNRYAVGDEWVVEDIAELYLAAKDLAEANKIVDGAGQKPHFSIRTLTRTLIYVREIVSVYGLRRALFEGFCMAFLTLLNKESENLLKPLIEKFTISKLKNAKQILSRCPPPPADTEREYVQFKHYWMRKGPGEVSSPNYIITPFVEKNLLNLVRATASRKFPVLVQGPTSAGKTSMIKYLADLTGHKFVRINNHEHTDLQEYLGTYVSDSSGKLVFREGVLVEALRKGHWIVLDELNLAPTDVLEALNRLLDDNRELFIPETQEVVHPHPDFMIFATQNPPGLYGGRKVLSRAFRNRFLELHFDDIPQDELEIILRERCKIAPSYAKKIVEVYRQLSVRRQSSRLFEQKNSFATLRDLFRWALRDAVGYEELAANGYMLLAERVRSPEEKQVVKETLEKVMRVKLDMDAYYESLENKNLMSANTSIVWTKAIRRLSVLVETSIKFKEPLLLVGETGCGKTTICQILALLLGRQIITVNAHQNTETGDILGAQRPVRNRFETRAALVQSLMSLFTQAKIEVTSSSYEDLLKKFVAVRKTLLSEDNEITPELIDQIEQQIRESSVLFEWSDGPLIQAMRAGEFFLLDEISLADDSVLERLNSVLEPERSLLLAEKGTDDTFIVAGDTFQFLATMNPGGDYGKKELSPALRNRFTEIWVPSMEDPNDVKQIVASKLKSNQSRLCESLVDYSYWFAELLSNGNATSGVISLRDILAWVQFINQCDESIPQEVVFLNGALMVFIDALGTNNTAYLAANEEALMEYKLMCVRKLAEISGFHLIPLFQNSTIDVEVTPSHFRAGSFAIARESTESGAGLFNLDAPTTAANAMRIIRAMQGSKPILLEGSPGVGKTSLVTALAKAVGSPLVRINLSEQTDLIDLFGSDAPVDGGNTGEFVWQDAPFLRAMKNGEWVLLDEMNLASQSVLEGLNACLDHRGEAYIPELDRSFPCHPKFKVFAAQNPQYQGGGRKGLPKSFVNRFSVVYMDMLKTEDLRLISKRLFPLIPESDCDKMISFISQLEDQVVVKKKWGQAGGPWEFNLRDTLRWMSLLSSKKLNVIDQSNALGDFLSMIVCQRFRTSEDREQAEKLFSAVFGNRQQKDSFFDLASDYIQVCGSLIARESLLSYSNSYDDKTLLALQSNNRILESAIRSINENIPFILTGPTNAGKTSIIRYLASTVGVKLSEFSMNSDVDSMDILGGYEQVDLTRDMNHIVLESLRVLNELVVVNALSNATDLTIVSKCLDLIGFMKQMTIESSNFLTFYSMFDEFASSYSNDALNELLAKAQALKDKLSEASAVKFNWFDGMLVRAVSRGEWLVLDNANLCNPSVLDRLNSLLETNGSLVINECSQKDGSARVLTPHANFRLFLTVDPKYGELSRAMRNRCIEVYVDDLAVRSTSFDRKSLNLDSDISSGVPVSNYVPSTDSAIRTFAQIHDCAQESSQVSASAAAGVLSLSSLDAVSAWSKSMSSAKLSQLYDTIEMLKSYLQQAGYVSNLGKIYRGLEINSLVGKQRLHYYVNQYVGQGIDLKCPAAEVTVLFQTAANILDAKAYIEKTESKALYAKVNELSFLETSAAVFLNRAIRKPPRVHVYAYVKAVAGFIEDVFKSSIMSENFEGSAIYSALLELQSIWSCLVKNSHTQNLSQLRVYIQLIGEWISTYELNPLVHAFVSKISSLEVGLELSSGYYMVKIWKKFRQTYPTSEEAWNNYARLCALFFEFDVIVQKLYSDAHEDSTTLRELLLNLYEDVVAEKIGGDELNQILESINATIIKLSDISGAFVVERHNRLVEEFTQLHNILESSNYFKKVDSAKLFKLANYTTKSTMSLVNSSKAALSPYPRIFDSLWKNEENDLKSLFTNETIITTLSKTLEMPKCQGKYLDQGLSDLAALRDLLADNSEHVLGSGSERFAKILYQWTLEILSLQCPDANLADPEQILALLNEDQSAASEVLKLKLLPVLHVLNGNPTLGQIGKAWVWFSTGCIQLFVPSSPLDPAIEEHVKSEVHNLISARIKDVIDSWIAIRTVISGDEPMQLEKDGPQVPELKSAKRQVFRSTESIDELFDEWNSFMETDIAPEPMENLLLAAENLQVALNEQKVGVFDRNTNSFLRRLEQKFPKYADLNDILIGFIYGAKLGVGLIRIEKENELATVPISYSWGLELTNILNGASIEKTFESIKMVTKSLDSSAILSEKLMHYFINLCFFRTSTITDVQAVDYSLEDIMTEAFQALYYRWYYRKMKMEENEAKESSLYKYKGAEDADEDFKDLFPNFDDVLNLELDTVKNDDGFEDIYFSIAHSYTQFYLSRALMPLSGLVEQGAELCAQLKNSRSDLLYGQSTSSQLASLLHMMKRYEDKFSTSQDREVSFYHDANPNQFARTMKLILSLFNTVAGLLAQWPEHATLQNISRTADEFLSYPSSFPLNKLLHKVEVIFGYITEWEKFASSEVTLKTHLDMLTQLIVSWRRLELLLWKSLFKQEELTFQKSIGKWWYHLFEVIVIPFYGNEDEIEDENVGPSPSMILAALNVFMSDAKLGEYQSRLDLLKAFKNHISSLSLAEKGTVNGISNLVTFYDLFVPQFNEHIQQVKKTLEKDVSEVILLASWKDVNIDALKQSSRKSHNNLYKIVRKYRALLSTPVSSMIENGYASDKLIPRELKLSSVAYVPRAVEDKLQILGLCQQITSWNQRPGHLKKLDTLENNMRVYTDRIAGYALPSLYEYAQSVVGEMERLKKETPSVMNDDTKKTVATLKTQKHKLLSDTLKELRRIGVNTSAKSDVKKAVATVNTILVNSESFTSTVLENTDTYYFRILELMPRLRSSVQSGNEEVPQVDLERGMAAAENLVVSLLATRKPLVDLARSVEKIEAMHKDIETLLESQGSEQSLLRASFVPSFKFNIEQLQVYSSNLFKILEYAVNLLENLPQFVGSSMYKILANAKSDLLEYKNSLPATSSKAYTENSIACVESFRSFILKFQSDIAHSISETPRNGFLGQLVLDWVNSILYRPFVNSCMTLKSLQTVEDFEKIIKRLTNNGIFSVQNILELQKENISEDDDKWFTTSQQHYTKLLKLLRHSTFSLLLKKCQEVLYQIEHNDESSQLCKALLAFTLPVISYYRKLCSSILSKASANYGDVSKSTYVLAKSLYTLASDGFCSPEPPSEQKKDDNLQDGTGLGDGEGVNNNSKDAEEDDDLTEHAQQPNEEQDKDEKNDEEDDDAVEMSGDMAGDLENMSDQEGDDNEEDEDENEDLDEEIDDLDDLDPNAIDEKMWDEEAKENEKEKDLDKMPENSVQDDENMEANEDEDQDKGDKDDSNSKDDGDDNENDEDAEEEDEVGEQEDEVKNDEGETLDDHVPESEALELPDDINLDNEESDKENDNDEDEFEDPMDVDEEENDEKSADKNDDGKADGEEENDEEEPQEEEETDAMADDNDNAEADEDPQEEPDVQDDAAAGANEEQPSDEEVGQQEEEKPSKEEDAEKDGQDEAEEAAMGEQGAEDANDEDVDMDAAVKMEAGAQGEGADDQVAEEQNDVGASGETMSDMKQEEKESVSEDSARDQMKESMKQLGDSLKEFHRRRNEIKEATDEAEKQEPEESANVEPDEFQHVEGENSKHDTQALAAADNKDQVQSIDEDLAIDEDDVQEEQPELEEPIKTEENDMDVDEENKEDSKDTAEADDFDGKTQGGVVGERREEREEDINALRVDLESQKLDLQDEEQASLEDYVIHNDEQPFLDIDTARALWKHSELATQELASGLCEQLRLILEPTLATKLRGDYKTGKRLNMKRIISYIASDFRKDKIWLRRTKPAKRQYQIMIAVDDSKSMSESGSTELALHSIALVSKALTQLESGGLSIVRFGEDVKLVHPFDKPFNQDVGANVFRWFDFQQEKTDIKQLCSKSLKIFENARSSSNADLWQLQIIISDGVCEDHETVRRLVRKAREEKVMLVFVVVDGISSKESILEMSQVSYVPDPVTGAMNLTVENYLDTFPFEFYVVVSNINELPEMLSLILRQYFSEVANM